MSRHLDKAEARQQNARFQYSNMKLERGSLRLFCQAVLISLECIIKHLREQQDRES